MSYHATAALQTALYQRLTTWPGLTGTPVLDAVPAGTAPLTYILIGPETARDLSDQTAPGAEHDLEVSVLSTASGFLAAKTVAAAVSEALLAPGLTLGTGHLVSIGFRKAQATRLDQGDTRRIDLRFRARVDF